MGASPIFNHQDKQTLNHKNTVLSNLHYRKIDNLITFQGSGYA